LADGNEGLLVSLRRSVQETFGRYSRFDEVFAELVMKIDVASTVASAERAEEESLEERSAEKSTRDVEAADKVASAAMSAAGRDQAACLAAPKEEERKRDEELFATRLTDMLPPKSDGSDYGISTAQLKAAVTLLNRINEILSDFGSFPISREESEGLTLLREEIDEHVKETKRKIELSKQLCCAHACAMYDAVRMFTDGLNSVGWGTKEFCARGHTTGLDLSQFLPKGYGEPCIPRQQKEEKLERAAARKNAALAALERERARRNDTSEENQEKRAAKAAALQVKREQEEKRLFVEAMDGLAQARFGGKSTADLATIARMWEKLGSMTSSRYPDTLKAVVHQSNVACALKELYSVDHFKGKDAISRLEKASATAMLILQGHSSYPRDSSKMLSKKQKEDLEEANQKLNVVIRRKSGGRGSGHDEEEGESDDDDGDNAEENADNFSKSNSSVGDGKGKSKGNTEEILLPDELVVPLFCVFQNFLGICREANNNFLLNKMERVKRVIRALYDVMLEHELIPLQEKNTMPPFGDVDILLCGEVTHQLADTLAELRKLEEDEVASHPDTDSTMTMLENDEEEAARTMEARKPMELTADTIARYKRRGVSGYTGGAGGAAVGANGQLLPIESEAEVEEDMLRRERDARKAKRNKQRKLDAEVRKQTVKQRNKLYTLITSGKINQIFANKAGHVLAEGQGIQWGDEAEADEADAFMEDSTQATSDDESSDESDTSKRKKTIADKADKKVRKEREAAEEIERQEVEERLRNGGSEKLTPSAGADDVKEEEKPKSSFFSFLFRNRDTNAPPPP